MDLAKPRNLTQRPPVNPGEPAPDLALPALHREGTVSLADYRGQSPLFLAFFRGFSCPFCRRQIGQLGGTAEKLKTVGVETLVVVGTPEERARLYLRFRPALVPIAADPTFQSHRSYGLPHFAPTTEFFQLVASVTINPFGDLPEPKPMPEVREVLERRDPYEYTESDEAAYRQQQIQAIGQFLIDVDGIVRWRNVEGADEQGIARGEMNQPSRLSSFPSIDDLLGAARAIAG